MSAGVKLLTDAASPDASCRRRSRVRIISPFPLRTELKIALARVVSRALSVTRGLSTTAHILSNGPPPDQRLDFRPRPHTRCRSRSGSRLSQRWTSRIPVYREAVMVIFFNTLPPGLQSYKMSSASSYFRPVFRFHCFGSYFVLLLGLLIFFYWR